MSSATSFLFWDNRIGIIRIISHFVYQPLFKNYRPVDSSQTFVYLFICKDIIKKWSLQTDGSLFRIFHTTYLILPHVFQLNKRFQVFHHYCNGCSQCWKYLLFLLEYSYKWFWFMKQNYGLQLKWQRFLYIYERENYQKPSKQYDKNPQPAS